MPSAEFTAMAEKVKTLTKATNEQLLKLYGLYKQATIGDCNTSRPGMFDPKGGMKWDSWNEKKGMSQEEAEKQYMAFAATLF